MSFLRLFLRRKQCACEVIRYIFVQWHSFDIKLKIIKYKKKLSRHLETLKPNQQSRRACFVITKIISALNVQFYETNETISWFRFDFNAMKVLCGFIGQLSLANKHRARPWYWNLCRAVQKFEKLHSQNQFQFGSCPRFWKLFCWWLSVAVDLWSDLTGFWMCKWEEHDNASSSSLALMNLWSSFPRSMLIFVLKL